MAQSDGFGGSVIPEFMVIVKADKKGVALAVKYLKTGKAIVYPTDTAYGLGVDATNAKAVKRLIKIKNRPGQPIHAIVENFSAAKKLAMFDEAAERIFKKLMPGPMTLVLPTLPPLNLPLPSGRGRRERKKKVSPLSILSAGTGTIGIRMPDNRVALELVRRLGRPITTPSANPHGGSTPYSIDEAVSQFKSKKYRPDLYLDAAILPKRSPSTIVSIKNGKIKILRKGPITKTQIEKCLI